MSIYTSYTTMVRSVLAQRLAEGQALTTREELMNALSVLPAEKCRVYEAVRQLKRRKEVVMEGAGFRYMPTASPDTLFARIYRVIRASKGGFTAADISSMAEVNQTRVRDVLEPLAVAGFLTDAGRKGRVKVWLATQKCRDTPTPPRLNFSQAPFFQERRALAKLVEIFMVAIDLSGSKTAANIAEQLDVLNRRFGGKGAAQ